MNTNRILRICGIVCMLCGLIISAIVFIDGEGSNYNKIIGPLQIVVGLLFIISSTQTKKP